MPDVPGVHSQVLRDRYVTTPHVSPFRRPPHAVTLGAAYSLADFTVLDRNPLDVASPDELRDINVLGTVMGGKAFPAGAIGENE